MLPLILTMIILCIKVNYAFMRHALHVLDASVHWHRGDGCPWTHKPIA